MDMLEQKLKEQELKHHRILTDIEAKESLEEYKLQKEKEKENKKFLEWQQRVPRRGRKPKR
jgi:hypothetical protein